MLLLRKLLTAVKVRGFLTLAFCLLAHGTSAAAQERPFTTARASTLGAGALRVDTGLRLTFDRHLPLSGLSGDLLEIQASVGFGLADRVEGRVEGVAWQHMSISSVDETAPLARELELEGTSTRDAGDVTLATRVQLTGSSQARLASAVQFGMRLPIAGNESGLGRDVTDVFAAVLGGWRSGRWRVAGEMAFAILGSPTRAAAQNDQGQLALLVEFQPRAGGVVLGMEGRTGFGDEGAGNELASELGAGARVRITSLWVDLSYRRSSVAGRASDGIGVGVSRVF